MRKFLIRILIFALLVLLAIWSPWLKWQIDFASIFGVYKPDSIAGLQVSSLAGDIEIFLDNQSVGIVNPQSSPFFLDRVAPGEHLLSIKRPGEFANTYATINRLINFEQNTTVIIVYNIGPHELFSEGHIIYATKKGSQNQNSTLNIKVNTSDFLFGFDTDALERISTNNLTRILDLSTQHKISLSKVGYESFEFTILPDNQSERDKLKNFDLNIEISLMLQPVEVTTN